MEDMTTLAYAKALGITKTALFKRVKKGGVALLPGCREIKVFPRQTVFVVDKQALRKSLKKLA